MSGGAHCCCTGHGLSDPCPQKGQKPQGLLFLAPGRHGENSHSQDLGPGANGNQFPAKVLFGQRSQGYEVCQAPPGGTTSPLFRGVDTNTDPNDGKTTHSYRGVIYHKPWNQIPYKPTSLMSSKVSGTKITGTLPYKAVLGVGIPLHKPFIQLI